MFLSLNALRPTCFSVDSAGEQYCFRVTTPLTPRQVIDTLSISGVSVGVLVGPVSELENGTVLKSDGLIVEALPNSSASLLKITTLFPPTISAVSGLSVIW